MANVTELQNNFSDGISTQIAVDHVDSASVNTGYSLKVTSCFDLESIGKETISDKAVADLKIVIEKISPQRGLAEFTLGKDYVLKMDENYTLSRKEPTDKGALVSQIFTISMAAGAAFMSAGIASPLILATIAGGESAAGALFGMITENNKTKSYEDKIEIRHYFWYSFVRWSRKPIVRIQKLKVELGPRDLEHGSLNSTVHYKLNVSARTGQKHRIRVHKKGKIDMNIHFRIDYH